MCLWVVGCGGGLGEGRADQGPGRDQGSDSSWAAGKAGGQMLRARFPVRLGPGDDTFRKVNFKIHSSPWLIHVNV